MNASAASKKTFVAAMFSSSSRRRPVNDNLMELLIMIECFKRECRAITAVIPYLATRAKTAKMKAVCRSPRNSLPTY